MFSRINNLIFFKLLILFLVLLFSMGHHKTERLSYVEKEIIEKNKIKIQQKKIIEKEIESKKIINSIDNLLEKRQKELLKSNNKFKNQENEISKLLDNLSKQNEFLKDKSQENQNIKISIAEMDIVRQQLRSCFNARAGTEIKGSEIVKIYAELDRNANIKKETVKVLETNISKDNQYYESIIESAVATLYNPLCAKLNLPLMKYEEWKTLIITIDYSWIN